MTVLVTPHRFADLEPERSTLEPLGAEVVAAADLDDLARLAPAANALLVTSFVRIEGELIERLAACRAIIRYGVGVSEVDVEAATRAGIPVGNVPDASVHEVADHAVLLALACLRRLPALTAAVAAGSWDITPLRGARRISTLTAAVLGLGRIGQATAKRLAAFGMNVVGYDPYVEGAAVPLVSLDEALAQADLITLHLPLTPETAGLLSEEKLALLPEGAVIVNVARGGIVDEDAVARRLLSGELWGAAFDVFAQEPLMADHPLRAAPNAVLTPHAAWYSTAAARDLQWAAAGQAARALRGERLDPVVNPSVYDRG